ncbi:hypothetical protein GCM10009760_26890 [Kitasatospora kazusensis]|uniref:Uncharacterized protein n=1 Tax=Kitasatospora kazusensis TaxID=407974 RepID=A0ABN2ZGZ1_9ACTN
MSARNTPAKQDLPPPGATRRTSNAVGLPPDWSPLDDYDPKASRRLTRVVPQAYEGCSCARCRTLLAATSGAGLDPQISEVER